VLNGHQTLALKQTIKNLLKKGRENYETHKLKTLPYNEAKKVACHMADGTPRSKFHPRKVKKKRKTMKKTNPAPEIEIWTRAGKCINLVSGLIGALRARNGII